MKFSKANRRRKIHYGIRNKISGTASRPRLSIFRSNRFIYCQIVDDLAGKTLASASSREENITQGGNKADQAKQVGKLIGERALQMQIETIVFDRGGYLYHGRVKALADGAREAGLKF